MRGGLLFKEQCPLISLVLARPDDSRGEMRRLFQRQFGEQHA